MITHSLVPFRELISQLVALGMVQEILHELGEDGFEFFQVGSLCHFVRCFEQNNAKKQKRARKGQMKITTLRGKLINSTRGTPPTKRGR